MIYYLTRVASWLAGHIARPVRLALAGPITVLVYYAWAAKRRATIANMAQVLGVPENDPRARRLARQSWRNYGRYISDFFYLPNATFDELLPRMKDVSPAPGAFGFIDQALAPGKGVILVSFHFGAWDVAAVMVRSHVPIDLIVESFDDPRMDKLVMDQRGKLGLGIIRIEKTPRRILRALQENRVVAVAVDKPVSCGSRRARDVLWQNVLCPRRNRPACPQIGRRDSPRILSLRQKLFQYVLYRGGASHLPTAHRRQAGRHHRVDATDVRCHGGNHSTVSRSVGNVPPILARGRCA